LDPNPISARHEAAHDQHIDALMAVYRDHAERVAATISELQRLPLRARHQLNMTLIAARRKP
jgi:hypothetical protein